MSNKPNGRKISYIISSNNASYSGVWKKILDQVTFWRLYGYEVQLFILTDKKSRDYWLRIDNNAIILFGSNKISNLIKKWKLISLAFSSTSSIVYLRDSFPTIVPKSTTPVVLEVQSRVGQELRSRSKANHILFRLFGKYIYANVAGAVYVTNELMNLNEFNLKNNVPQTAIGNGIDFARVEPLPIRDEVRKALFFLGSPNQAWHGISEIIEFASLNPEIDIHIVGDSGLNPPSNVKFYGTLTPSEYFPIAAKCIAGIGSLNLKSKQMSEACPLKVREYLALGLPVILKYQDTDFPDPVPYVLQLPSDGRRLKDFSKEINSFLLRWDDSRVLRSEITHLDAAGKEKTRLEFLEAVANINTNRHP